MSGMIIIFVLLCSAFPKNQDKILTVNEPLNGVESMKVNIDYSLGNLVIEAGQSQMAVTGYLKYNSQSIDGSLEYDSFGNTGILRLNTDIDVSWDMGFNKTDKNKVYNESELYISPEVPIKMDINVGMGKSDISLNNLKTDNFILDCGMCETTIDFGESYNSVICRTVDIDAGLGSATVRNLLNSNSDRMEFECGLGSMYLEFGGKLKHDIDVDISIGLGSVEIKIPEGLNVVFKYDGSFLSNVDLDGFSQIDDEYRSKNYNEDNYTISVSGSIGAGSLKITWINE